jgi:hypothetical protein
MNQAMIKEDGLGRIWNNTFSLRVRGNFWETLVGMAEIWAANRSRNLLGKEIRVVGT